MVKKLKCLVAFQYMCLADGNWEDYDKVENSINRLEKEIVSSKRKK